MNAERMKKIFKEKESRERKESLNERKSRGQSDPFLRRSLGSKCLCWVVTDVLTFVTVSLIFFGHNFLRDRFEKLRI